MVFLKVKKTDDLEVLYPLETLIPQFMEHRLEFFLIGLGHFGSFDMSIIVRLVFGVGGPSVFGLSSFCLLFYHT
jgi:hypothetical protein